MSIENTNPNVLLSGSTGGIGFEIASKLVRNGASVTINGRSQSKGKKALDQLREHDPSCHFVQGNINEFESTERIVEEAINKMGTIDVLVATGGNSTRPPLNFFRDMNAVDVLKFCRTQYANRLFLIKAILSHLIENGGGRIINLSTDAGRVPTPGEVGVGGAAAALQHATRTMAKEFSRWDITVNTLFLTVVLDQFELEDMNENTKKVFEEVRSRQVFKLESSDVGEIVNFLAQNPGAAPITGQTISITGGVSF